MADAPKPLIRMGAFTLDLQRRVLSGAAGEPVLIASRPLAALSYLAARPGVLVTKRELKAAVWPDVSVEDNSISQCISAVRRALGEAPGEHRFIATEPGRGYRFIAPMGSGLSSSDPRFTSANPHAFQAYVLGWSALTRPGEDKLRRGVQELERAVRLDPGFALAHVCLADGYALLAIFGQAAPNEVAEPARIAVRRALAIAPEFAEAHAELGHLQMTFDRDRAAAEASLVRALELDETSVLARHYMGLFCLGEGRFEEAIHHLMRAQTREPLAANISANIGMAHYYARRYHEAIAQLTRALELDPHFSHAQSLLGRAHMRLGDVDVALTLFRARSSRTLGSDADIPAALALGGRTVEARDALRDLLRPREGKAVSNYDLAVVYVASGELEAAISILESPGESALTSFLRYDPAFDALRDDRRFELILQRLR